MKNKISCRKKSKIVNFVNALMFQGDITETAQVHLDKSRKFISAKCISNQDEY